MATFTISDEEYLKNDKIYIGIFEFDFDTKRILVSTEDGTFFSLWVRPKLVKKDVLARYNTLLRLARENNVKIKYKSHLRRRFLDNWNIYQEVYQEYLNTYDELLKLMPGLKQRGIHYNYKEGDRYLAKCFSLRDSLDRFFKPGSVLYSMQGIDEVITMEINRISSSTPEYPVLKTYL